MAVRTEQSNVSSRHDGADYMRQTGGKGVGKEDTQFHELAAKS